MKTTKKKAGRGRATYEVEHTFAQSGASVVDRLHELIMLQTNGATELTTERKKSYNKGRGLVLHEEGLN